MSWYTVVVGMVLFLIVRFIDDYKVDRFYATLFGFVYGSITIVIWLGLKGYLNIEVLK
jgi:hypothetical protein